VLKEQEQEQEQGVKSKDIFVGGKLPKKGPERKLVC
tara:strand:+ start:1265 stop:1372 length:108 start_codon:yes stop_codon:yes gene_type:complete